MAGADPAAAVFSVAPEKSGFEPPTFDRSLTVAARGALRRYATFIRDATDLPTLKRRPASCVEVPRVAVG